MNPKITIKKITRAKGFLGSGSEKQGFILCIWACEHCSTYSCFFFL